MNQILGILGPVPDGMELSGKDLIAIAVAFVITNLIEWITRGGRDFSYHRYRAFLWLFAPLAAVLLVLGRATFSLRFIRRDTGAASGFGLEEQDKRAKEPRRLSTDMEERIRSMARAGHRMEAIDVLRMASNCSVEEANSWLNDNC